MLIWPTYESTCTISFQLLNAAITCMPTLSMTNHAEKRANRTFAMGTGRTPNVRTTAFLSYLFLLILNDLTKTNNRCYSVVTYNYYGHLAPSVWLFQVELTNSQNNNHTIAFKSN